MWKFKPIFKHTVWGGTRIQPFKGLDVTAADIGESWEMSGIEGSESVVDGGPDNGLSLSELLRKYGAAILGERNYKRYGERFPLLIKLIDAEANLSVQVHPDDDMALRMGLPNGKTEMWYVIDARKGGRLAMGFKKPLDPDDYHQLVTSGDIEHELKYIDVHNGEVYIIPAGRVHSIGAGCLVAEIQQTSDATYRMYDYGRRDARGNARELHTEMAREAADFNDTDAQSEPYVPMRNIPVSLARCPYFTVNMLDLDSSVMRDYAELDSFIVFMVLKGNGRLLCGPDAVANEPSMMTVRQGDTVLVSASAKGLTFEPEESGLTLLEIYKA